MFVQASGIAFKLAFEGSLWKRWARLVNIRVSAGLESVVRIILEESFLLVQFNSSLKCRRNSGSDGRPYRHGGNVPHPGGNRANLKSLRFASLILKGLETFRQFLFLWAPKSWNAVLGIHPAPPALPQHFFVWSCYCWWWAVGEVMFLLQGGVRCCLSWGPLRG